MDCQSDEGEFGNNALRSLALKGAAISIVWCFSEQLLNGAAHITRAVFNENGLLFLPRGQNLSIFRELYVNGNRQKSAFCCFADSIHQGQHCTGYIKLSSYSPTLLNI